MNNFLLVIVLSFVFFISCGKPPKINGHWRRLDIAEKRLSPGADNQYGDFILEEDSTFTMVGNDSLSSSNITGWHAGGTMKGNWKLEGKSLYLYVSGVRMPLTYSIKRLTRSDLQFQSNFANSPVFNYKRVN